MLQAKNHIVLISLSTGGGSSTGVPLNHTAATRRRTFDHQQQLIQRALRKVSTCKTGVIQKDSDFSYDQCNAEPYVSALAAAM
jgi:hypothetical protein